MYEPHLPIRHRPDPIASAVFGFDPLFDYEDEEEDEEEIWSNEAFLKLENLGFLGNEDLDDDEDEDETIYNYKIIGNEADIMLRRADGSLYQMHCSLDDSPDMIIELKRQEFVSWY